MLLLSVISHAIQVRCHLCRALVYVEHVLFQFRSHVWVEYNTFNIGQLVWESCNSYAVPCQECSNSVEEYHSCHKQVSVVLQRYKEDDMLLVAIDTKHHDTHHKTVLCQKCSNSCWLPFGNSSGIRVSWKQVNLSVDIRSVCLGNLSVPIILLPALASELCMCA